MCGGRPAHHIEEEKRREAQYLADMERQAAAARQAEMDRMMAFQQQAAERQTEALRQITETAKAPIKVKTTADATTPIMSTRQKKMKEATGVAALRINRTPGTNLDLGIGSSGTNIG